MPLPPSFRRKIDLLATDPTGYLNEYVGIQPEDEFLSLQMGMDYSKYMQMRRDSHVRSVLGKRRQAILGRRVIVESRSTKLKDRLGIDLANQILERISYESICSSLLGSGQLIGFSVLRLDLVEMDGLLIPKTQFVPQNRFSFAYHKPDDRSIPVATGESLNPETDIILINGYELRLLTKSSPLTGERCPKGRFIVYTFDADNSPWGLGLGYSIYPWWIVKREALKAWTFYCDRLGSPPVIGNHPPELNPKVAEDAALLRKFEEFLASISPNGWAKLPDGFSAKLLEGIAALGAEPLQSLIGMADAQVSKTVLGEVQYSDKLSGSYAANNSQVEDRESSLTDADINILDEHLDRDLWTLLAEVNYRNNARVIVRRESIADRRKQEADQQKATELSAIANKDAQLISGLQLEPTDKYIQETYGDGWTKKPAQAPSPPQTPQFAEFSKRSGLLSIPLPESLANRLAQPGYEEPAELHLTVAYFGELAEPPLAQWIADLELLCHHTSPFSATINGVGRFNGSSSSSGKDVIYAVVDAPGLIELRFALLALSSGLRQQAKANHGFTPHITLAYVEPEQDLPVRLPTIPWTIDRVNLNVGTTRYSFALNGSSDFTATKIGGNPNRDALGRFAHKGAHAAQHLTENVAAWKTGKVLGSAIASIATSHGANPEVARLLGETTVQALTATGIDAAKGKRTPGELARRFVAESAAALAGKLAHGAAESAVTTLGGSERVRQISALFAGKTTGIATNAAATKFLANRGTALKRILGGVDSFSDYDDVSGILQLTSDESSALFDLAIAAYCATAIGVEFEELTNNYGVKIDRVLTWAGLDVGVEFLPGETRFPDQPFAKPLDCGYGHLRGYLGYDQKAVDAYVRPSLLPMDGSAPRGSEKLFELYQRNPTTTALDEVKVMIGFDSEQQAIAAYLREMPIDFFGGIREVSKEDLDGYRRQDFSEPLQMDGEELTAAQWKNLAQITPESIADAIEEMIDEPEPT